MELRQLRYFVQVAKQESFSRAASHLNIAQSALSRQIRLLEWEIGAELLLRHGRGAKPTPAGKVLLKRATRILRNLDEVRLEVAGLGTAPAGQVSLALPPSTTPIFAQNMLERCEAELPNVSLKLLEAWTGHIREWLLVERCDLGILYSVQADDKVVFQPLLTEDLCLIVSAHWQDLWGRTSVSLEEISEMPLIVPTHPHGLRRVIENAFTEKGLDANIAYEAEVWSVIKDRVDSGLAHTLISPSEMWPEFSDGKLRAIPIKPPGMKRTLGVAVASGRKTIPAIDAVFALIKRMAKPPSAIR